MSKRSAVSFIRRQLKTPGSSEHSGRGFVTMYSNVYYTYDELHEMAQKLLPRWKKRGLVKSYEEFPANGLRGRSFAVEFVPEVFGKYYRTWQVLETTPPCSELGVISM